MHNKKLWCPENISIISLTDDNSGAKLVQLAMDLRVDFRILTWTINVNFMYNISALQYKKAINNKLAFNEINVILLQYKYRDVPNFGPD